jgi:acetylglutamate kinase
VKAPQGPIVVKVGGRATEREETLAALAVEIATLSRKSRIVLVHGGGAEVTALAKQLGMEPVFKDGIRQTSPREMDVVDMVLSGRINKRLVRLLRARGLDAVGLSGSDGGIFTGAPMGPAEETRTGDVAAVDARLLELLLENGYLPVLCSTSMDAQGRALNINADAVALSLAARLSASALVFFSDVPGVLCDGSVVQALSSSEADDLVTRGTITGGMVPKVLSSLEAIRNGVRTVIIGQYEGAGSLARLLEGKQGTRIWQ